MLGASERFGIRPALFLFLGDLQPDGTRANGQQQQVIDRVVASSANAFHVILWRMNRTNMKNEGDDTHSPFVDHDPAKPLNEAVLKQWEGWIAQFEAAGVVVHVDFYDDPTDVEKIGWVLDAQGNLHPDERRFITGIVSCWKRFKSITWSVGESVNKLPRARIPHLMKTTEAIAKTAGRFTFFVNGKPRGDSWESLGAGPGWVSHMIRDVEIAHGDELRIDGEGRVARLDYVQLNPPGAKPAPPKKAPPPAKQVAR